MNASVVMLDGRAMILVCTRPVEGTLIEKYTKIDKHLLPQLINQRQTSSTFSRTAWTACEPSTTPSCSRSWTTSTSTSSDSSTSRSSSDSPTSSNRRATCPKPATVPPLSSACAHCSACDTFRTFSCCEILGSSLFAQNGRRWFSYRKIIFGKICVLVNISSEYFLSIKAPFSVIYFPFLSFAFEHLGPQKPTHA